VSFENAKLPQRGNFAQFLSCSSANELGGHHARSKEDVSKLTDLSCRNFFNPRIGFLLAFTCLSIHFRPGQKCILKIVNSGIAGKASEDVFILRRGKFSKNNWLAGGKNDIIYA
jgi:hypothetical protein